MGIRIIFERRGDGWGGVMGVSGCGCGNRLFFP
jgi:hypothetical protein